MPQDVVDSVQRDIERMFDRHIFDFLVQYFVAEINWIDQLIHPPSFLAQYQEWWAKGTLLSVVDVEFAVLLLRICSYASQFLPSPSHTIDTIRGMLLADIRNTCDDIGDNLAAVCTSLDTRGSLLRVQHLCFAGLSSRCEGRTNAFWEALNGAIRVAQRVGIHRDAVTLIPGGMHELEKEMRRERAIAVQLGPTDKPNSLLSRQLDRIPFLPCSMGTENLPRMHLAPDIGDVHAPEAFTERVLQVHLAGFWRSFGPSRGAEYDLTVAEERYERFCSEFLTTLPSAFALQPDQKWDERLPALPMQRQLLWMAIFDSVCWNFRQVLLLEPSYVLSLPPYKQVLLLSQKMALAMAALHVLQAVSALHAMLGASHTRYTGIIFHTFEAAVILVGLCLDPDFPGDAGDGPPRAITTDPLGIRTASLTQERCMQAVQDGLNRLRMLADVSNMAEAGARTLARLLGRPTRASAVSHALEGSNCVQSWSSDSDEVCWSSLEHLDPNQLGGMLPAAVSEDWYPNLDLFPIGFDLSSLPNVLV
ncbi:hypothetical protein MMC27_001052 [Xylographa pallens]|nr:hypothetical protein [Xylographa pallens]